MTKRIRDTKIRTLIKAYLVFNRGKRCTAKEISEWINGNKFNLNQSLVNPNLIGRLLYMGKYSKGHILNEVNVEKKYNLNYYWVN